MSVVKKGKNDGSVDNVRYFECPPNHGLFVLPDKVNILDPAAKKSTKAKVPSTSSQSSDAPQTTPTAPVEAEKAPAVAPAITPAVTAAVQENEAFAPEPSAEDVSTETPDGAVDGTAEDDITARLKRLHAMLGETDTDLTPAEMLAHIEAKLLAVNTAAAATTSSRAIDLSASTSSDATPAPDAAPADPAVSAPATRAPPAVAPKRRVSDSQPPEGFAAEAAKVVAAAVAAKVGPPVRPRGDGPPAQTAPAPAQAPAGKRVSAGGPSLGACPVCMLAVTDGASRLPTDPKTVYHEKCFVCAKCSKPIVAETGAVCAGKLYCHMHFITAQAESGAAPAGRRTSSPPVSGGDLKSKMSLFSGNAETESPRRDSSEQLETSSTTACTEFTAHAFKPEKCANCQLTAAQHPPPPAAATGGPKRAGSVRNIITKHEATSRGVTIPEGSTLDVVPEMSVRDRTTSLINASKPGKTSPSATPTRRTSFGGGSKAPSPGQTASPKKDEPGLQRTGSVRASIGALMKPADPAAPAAPRTPDAPGMTLRERMASLSGERPKPFEADAAARAEAVKETAAPPANAAPRVAVSSRGAAAAQTSAAGPTSAPEASPAAAPKKHVAAPTPSPAFAPAPFTAMDAAEPEPEPAEPAAPAAVETAGTLPSVAEEEPAAADTTATDAADTADAVADANADGARADGDEPAADAAEMDEDEAELAALRAQIEALKRGAPAVAAAAASAVVAVPHTEHTDSGAHVSHTDSAPHAEPPAAAPPVLAAARTASPDFYGSDDEKPSAAPAPTHEPAVPKAPTPEPPAAHVPAPAPAPAPVPTEPAPVAHATETPAAHTHTDAAQSAAPAAHKAANPFNPFGGDAAAADPVAPKRAKSKQKFNPFG